VELAIFRVAQEAISNAVKHGGPPIVVRYVTGASNASLSVVAASLKKNNGSGAIAPRPGHYGLATMQQRTELIGALLSIRAWPGGGTRVSLEWKTS
jgi:signal transduction histidine kinase